MPSGMLRPMDDLSASGLLEWIEARSVELLGLSVLLAGAAALTIVFWWSGRPVPPAPAAEVGVELSAWDDDAGRASAPADDVVTVHVTGAVHTPSLVHLDAGSRVADAIHAVGGAIADADLQVVNLARRLTDGEQVHVPRIGEREGGGATTPDGRVDVNRADAATLQSLPGVGPTRAAAIVSHRERHGPFTTPGDLRAVNGIGEATFQTLADLVVVR
ncbi:MAG: helix-hairpin-helix domain-containing protein [Nitriliruptoraceae bacterium]